MGDCRCLCRSAACRRSRVRRSPSAVSQGVEMPPKTRCSGSGEVRMREIDDCDLYTFEYPPNRNNRPALPVPSGTVRRPAGAQRIPRHRTGVPAAPKLIGVADHQCSARTGSAPGRDGRCREPAISDDNELSLTEKPDDCDMSASDKRMLSVGRRRISGKTMSACGRVGPRGPTGCGAESE